MSNPSKQKGTSYETAVANYLVSNGFPYAERRALNGSTDRGDIAGIPGLVLELKACKTLKLSEWMDEVRVEKDNAHAEVATCVIKRRSHSVGKSYVVMELDSFIDLIR